MNLRGVSPFELTLISDAFEVPGSPAGLTLDVESYHISKLLFKKNPRNLNHHFSANVKGVATFRNAHSYWLIEDTMRILIQAGIPQYIKKFIILFCFKETREVEVKIPKVFSINDLEFGFVVWLVACSVAIAGFLCELMWFYCKEGLRNFVGLCCIVRFLGILIK